MLYKDCSGNEMKNGIELKQKTEDSKFIERSQDTIKWTGTFVKTS